MEKRHKILDRFNSTQIGVYDMTVLPDDPKTFYTFKNKETNSQVVEKISKNFKQIPFTKMLRFRKEDLQKLGENLFFLCSARIKIAAEMNLKLKIGFVTDNEKMSLNELT